MKTIELHEAQIDAIIIADLKDVYEYHDPSNRPSWGMYSSIEEEDLKEMKKMRKALKRVLEYYGATV